MSDYYFLRAEVIKPHTATEIFSGVHEFTMQGQHPRDILDFIVSEISRKNGINISYIYVTAFNKL